MDILDVDGVENPIRRQGEGWVWLEIALVDVFFKPSSSALVSLITVFMFPLLFWRRISLHFLGCSMILLLMARKKEGKKKRKQSH